MTKRWTMVVGLAVFGLSAPGHAQDVPEGQSCGGLVCDLGLFGHKTAPRAEAVPPAAVAPPAPSAAPAATAARVAAPAPRKRVARKPKPRAPAAVAAAPAAPVAPAAAAMAAPPPPAAPPPAAIPVTATPASGPVVLANPYVYTKPLPFMFQSVDPTQGVQ